MIQDEWSKRSERSKASNGSGGSNHSHSGGSFAISRDTSRQRGLSPEFDRFVTFLAESNGKDARSPPGGRGAVASIALPKKVGWAANKRFNILKFKFKFPIARTFELFRARSRLYRSQILQVNTRWNSYLVPKVQHLFPKCSIFYENFILENGAKECIDESFPTSIYLQNVASIQPRTSPKKFESSSSREFEFKL